MTRFQKMHMFETSFRRGTAQFRLDGCLGRDDKKSITEAKIDR